MELAQIGSVMKKHGNISSSSGSGLELVGRVLQSCDLDYMRMFGRSGRPFFQNT